MIALRMKAAIHGLLLPIQPKSPLLTRYRHKFHLRATLFWQQIPLYFTKILSAFQDVFENCSTFFAGIKKNANCMSEKELTVELVCNLSPYALGDTVLDSLLMRHSRPEVLLYSNNHLALHCLQHIHRLYNS